MSAAAERYDAPAVEARWQARWAAARCFEAAPASGKPRFYNFDGGPFPNGPLHMGHVRTFTLGDVMARFQRMRGRDVLYAFEFDAFGLPNELAAEARGVTPSQFTSENIERMRAQMRQLGLSYDWRHVHSTCDPRYYRWTQWLFLRLLERGLVYRADADLPFCPSCETTLAHMQVEQGRCWRCETPVERRRLPQWYIALTARSEVLYESIDDHDGFSPRVKRILKGFLAPVPGLTVPYAVLDHPGATLDVFVPDGVDPREADHVAAAVDHPDLPGLLRAGADGPTSGLASLRAASKPKRRTGAETSAFPEPRDSGLRLACPWTGAEVRVLFDSTLDRRFAGGLRLCGAAGAGPPDAIPGSARVRHFQVHDWLVSRQRSWGTPIPIVHCDGCGAVPVPEAALPVELPEVVPPREAGGLGALEHFVATSCPRCRRPARRETDTLDCYFDVVWCFLACATQLDAGFAFRREDFACRVPVDWFHNGLDSFFYVHLYRFLGRVLHEMGLLDAPEPIRAYHGHDAVLLGGRKMSKHHGNVVAPDAILARAGADALRVHVLGAAGPGRALDWDDAGLARARRLLDDVWRLVAGRRDLIRAGRSAHEGRMPKQVKAAIARTTRRITAFLERYRLAACIEELHAFAQRLEEFARLVDQRPKDAAWRAGYAGAAERFVRLLAPFAPHLAEELFAAIGGEGLLATTAWPDAGAPVLDSEAGERHLRSA